MARGANKFVRRGLDLLQDVLEVVSEVLMGLGTQASTAVPLIRCP